MSPSSDRTSFKPGHTQGKLRYTHSKSLPVQTNLQQARFHKQKDIFSQTDSTTSSPFLPPFTTHNHPPPLPHNNLINSVNIITLPPQSLPPSFPPEIIEIDLADGETVTVADVVDVVPAAKIRMRCCASICDSSSCRNFEKSVGH